MMEITIPEHGTLDLTPRLLDNLCMVHGRERVDDWLATLGPRLAGILDELGARIVPGDPPLSYHLVCFAERATGEQVVIKCTVPNDDQPPELAAVHALSVAGIGPRLLWSDLDRGALAMARVLPGDILPTGLPTLAEDAETTRLIAALATRMAREVDVERWRDALVPVEVYSRALGEVPPESGLWQSHSDDIERALTLRQELLAASDRRDVFLHGDLHHYNVLRDARLGPCVIDPKGLVGPPGYDVGAFMYNPMGIQHHPDFAAITRQRIDIWSEVSGLPWEEVRSWGYIAAVLSACWSGQGGEMAWQEAMTVAESIRDLAPFR